MSLTRFIYLFLLSLAAFSCTEDLPDGEYTLELYSHGDLHGRFFSTLPRISTIIGEARNNSGREGVMFIDLGDHNHGSDAAYYFNRIYDYPDNTDHIYSRLANELGYDAIVVGNHDIEAGCSIFNKIKEELKMPYLGANVLDNSSSYSYLQPYTVIDKQGIKVAVIGFTTPSVELWVGKEKMNGIRIEKIHRMADSLVQHVNSVENPHFTILALHSGSGNGSSSDYENVASYLASNIKGVDLILSAHDHLSNVADIEGIYIVNSGPYGNILDKTTIELKIEDGKVLNKDISVEEINTKGVLPDSSFLGLFSKEIKLAEDFSNTSLGIIDSEIDPKLILGAPCTYSNLLHYVQLQESGADISFVSPTKFTGTIDVGNVTYGDILELYPFENTLYTVSMTGIQIKKYLEESYSIFNSTGKVVGKPYMFDCAGGLKYEITLSKPVGERVEILSFTDGTLFDLNSTYKAAMVSYRANGGGELLQKATGLEPSQLDSIILQRSSDIRDLLFQFLKSGKPLSVTDGIADWQIIY